MCTPKMYCVIVVSYCLSLGSCLSLSLGSWSDREHFPKAQFLFKENVSRFLCVRVSSAQIEKKRLKIVRAEAEIS